MPKERIKRYERVGISKNRYGELKYIAKQYDELQSLNKTPSEGDIRKIQAIEVAAQAADSALFEWILQCVTAGKTFEQLNPPCGRVQFFRARTRFFIELNRLLA